MKLEKFKEKSSRKKFIIVFTVVCILLLAGVFLYTSFAVFTEEKQFNVINGTYQDPGDLYFSVYIDGQITNTFPKKEDGYLFDSTQSSCTNGATVSWDEDSWSALVNFSDYQAGNMSKTKCTMYFRGSIVSKIIAQLDTTGACPTVNEDGTVSVTSAETEKSLVCSAPDDYGTSYYFRGNVENNWVKFAGYYWRIIRVNGDGTLRMIYSGDASVIDALKNKEEVLKNGYDDSTTRYTQIGVSAFNENFNDNAYVGYMYGTPGSSTYEQTHANINDSTIKTYIDNWYATHLLNTEYEKYISDTLFCSDRTISEYKASSDYTNLGYKTEYTSYRWDFGPWHTSSHQNPTLMCFQSNDQFTAMSIPGNSLLAYSIGLINTDEIVLSGGYSVDNTSYYLYTGYTYWTMSPYGYYENDALIRKVSSTGNTYDGQIERAVISVRPVINVRANTFQNGDGTALNPYRE